MKSYLLSFEEIHSDDFHLVGGKGYNLAKLYNKGFKVPKGFCVTTLAFKDFLDPIKHHPLFCQLNTLKSDDKSSIKKISSDLRKLIHQQPLHPVFIKLLNEKIHAIGKDTFYAVRSSATAEDLPTLSFAGQQDTYLNILGVENILENIIHCFASLYTDRAILYRIEHHIPHDDIFMSVVIQEMIHSKISGILFTSNPMNNAHNQCTIDASYGLGEALVSGMVTPDLYIVDKIHLNVIHKDIPKKTFRIVPKSSGGTEKNLLSDDLSQKQVLNDDEILNLTQMGMRIEKTYDFPQDIEWCIDDLGQIMITQSRPITSLYPVPKSSSAEKKVFVSFNHFQMMLHPIHPLGISNLRYMLGFVIKDISENPYLIPCGGRIYIDVTPFLKTKAFKKILPKGMKNIDERMAQAIKYLLEDTTYIKPTYHLRFLKKFIKFVHPVLLKGLHLYHKKPIDAVTKINDYIEDQVEDFSNHLESIKDPIEQIESIKIHLHNLLLHIFYKVLPYMLAGLLSLKKIQKKLKKRGLSKDITDHFLKGLIGNVTTEMGLQLNDVGDVLREYPNLLEILRKDPTQQGIEAIFNEPFTKFHEFFQSFMKQYGMRGPGEIDISNPIYLEDPTILIQSMLAHIDHSEPQIHREKYEKLIKKSDTTAHWLIDILGKSIVPHIKRIRNYLPLREHGKYYIIRNFHVIRKTLDKISEHLVKEGKIHKGDLDYLTYDEILRGLRKDIWDQDLLKERRKRFHHHKLLTPPRVMLDTGEIIVGKIKKDHIPEGAFIGKGVSKGIVSGYAKVLTQPNEDIVKKDEILVAPFTDPGWTPLFVNAKGLVLEIGGLMTHGAVVAREYGIPAIVGVNDATKNIQTGDYILVDADHDYVKIIKDPKL